MSIRLVLPRVVLAAIGALLVFVGVKLGLNPDATGLAAQTPAGATNIRVLFGGFHAGLGLFAIACALRQHSAAYGLFALVSTGALVIVFRLFGLRVDGSDQENLTLLAREGVSLVVLASALVLARHPVAARPS